MATFKDVLQLVDKVTQPLQKINDKMKEVGKTSDKTKGKLERLQAGFKRVGVVAKGVAKVGSAVAVGIGVVGGAMLAGAKKVADYGDRIDKMSQQIGMNRQSFQEWDYIMSQNGGNVESLKMGFKTLTTQIEGVQKGSKDSIKAFGDLGVSVKDSNGQFRSQEDVFNDTVRALQKIKDPTKKAMLANRLFGRSAVELKPLLNQEADAIDELRAKANKMGLIISDKDIDNAVKYKDTMDTFSRVFEAKFATVMMSIMPDLTKGIEELMQVMQDNQEIFDNIGISIKWIVATAIPALVKGIVAIINGFQAVGGAIGTFIGTIISIPTYISMAINTAKTAVIIFINDIIKKIEELIAKIRGIAGAIVGSAKDAVKGVASGISNKISNITNNTTSNSNNINTTNNNTYNYNGMLPFAGAKYAI